MNQKLIIASSISIIHILAIQSLAQKRYVTIGDSEAVVFRTSYGMWTANHVGTGFQPSHFSKTQDIQFRLEDNRGRLHYTIGNGHPDHFICRRGRTHLLTYGNLNRHVWSTPGFRFFPGESGSPIFSRDGTVCGIVLGNYFDNKTSSWVGRVAKIRGFNSRIMALNNNLLHRKPRQVPTVTVFGEFEPLTKQQQPDPAD